MVPAAADGHAACGSCWPSTSGVAQQGASSGAADGQSRAPPGPDPAPAAGARTTEACGSAIAMWPTFQALRSILSTTRAGAGPPAGARARIAAT